ncbi:MAG TPA: hypothetical protein VF508_08865, partial [Pyrinomonadaceae bacterium]
MQAVLLAAPVRRQRDEDVAAHERAQGRGRLRVEAVARLRLDALQQADAQQKLLHLGRLAGEDLL